MVESIPEKDQFLIAYPNYVLRETVTYISRRLGDQAIVLEKLESYEYPQISLA